MSKLPTFKNSATHLGLQSASSYGSGLKQSGTAAPQAHSTSILERIKQANSIRNNYKSPALRSHKAGGGYADQCLGLTQQNSLSDLSGYREVNSVLSSSLKVGSFSEKNSKTVLKVS